MGAGYKTTSPVFVDDKMLKLPWQLMSQTIQAKDKETDENIATVETLAKKFKLNAIANDKDRAQELGSMYDQRADEVVDKILKNPYEYKRQIADIRAITRDFDKDMETGEWAAISDRYNTHINSLKDIQDLKAEDGYSDEWKRKKISKELEDAGDLQYDPATGKYKKYNTLDVTQMKDMNKFTKEVLTGMAKDGSKITQDTINGGWNIETKEGSEHIDEAEVARILNNAISGDPELLAAIRQRADLGVTGYEGTVDADGNLISPSEMVYMSQLDEEGNVVKDAEGNEVKIPRLQFADNFIGSSVKAATEKFGFKQTEYSRKLKRTDQWKMNYADTLARNREIDKEKRNSQLVSIVRDGELKSPSGTDAESFAKNRDTAVSTISSIKEQALAKVKEKLGGADIPKEVFDSLVEHGDFSILLDETIGLPEHQVAEMQRNFNRAALDLSIIDGTRKTWEADIKRQYDNSVEAGKEMPDFNTYLEMSEPAFNQYLDTAGRTDVPVNYSWGAIGINDKAAKSIQDQFEELKGIVQLDIPQLGGRTIDQAIQDGIIIVEKEKIPFEEGMSIHEKNKITKYNELSARENSTENPLTFKEKKDLAALLKQDLFKNRNKIGYKIKDGNGYVNFEINSNSLIPSTELDDNGSLNLGVSVNIGGKSAMAKVSSNKFTVPAIQQYKNANGQDLKLNNFLETTKKVNNVQIPGSDWILDGKEGVIRKGNEEYPIYNKNGVITTSGRKILMLALNESL